METIPNQKTCGQSSNVYDPRGKSIYYCCSLAVIEEQPPHISRDFTCKQATTRKVLEERRDTQLSPEHHAFRSGSITVWAGILLEYLIDLHMFTRRCMKVV
ncbi:hypothetical protein CDAR_586041 [Caerostris darwini]|uniref:Uncharacterized protein n=1 Tax=Caerostris darwini TaxID=1538125 RepID=A0AAV4VFS1_9ARAC|nr:hypothetical protein CDAR_586041 [Caerostris darwini]